MNISAFRPALLILPVVLSLLAVPPSAFSTDNVTSSQDPTIFALPSGTTGVALSTSGSGTRMIWYPKKGAFRAGTLDSTPAEQWVETAIGAQSFAAGLNVVASGPSSVAFGSGTTASGSYSTAFGFGTIASSLYSTAFGGSTSATGYYGSFASGMNSIASGYTAHALGYGVNASGYNSTALGYNTVAGGSASTATGRSTRAEAVNSTSMGEGTVATAFNSLVIGRYNDPENPNRTAWVATDPVFVIGNGTSTTVNNTTTTIGKNALVVRKNGDVTMTGKITFPRQGDILMGDFGTP